MDTTGRRHLSFGLDLLLHLGIAGLALGPVGLLLQVRQREREKCALVMGREKYRCRLTFNQNIPEHMTSNCAGHYDDN